jgi:hypothetical protein
MIWINRAVISRKYTEKSGKWKNKKRAIRGNGELVSVDREKGYE